MKLNKSDKLRLLDAGHPESDFPQIEEATQKSKTSYELDGKKISREKVIELIGREDYLLGIARSAFHFTAAMGSGEGVILFDSHNLFRGR